MLESYFQNLSVGMTKQEYFDMCEALGTEPIEEEIPVELSDFPIETQVAIDIYYKLHDEWDGMSGTYLGKSYAGLMDILDIFNIPKQDRKYVLDWLGTLDKVRSKLIKATRPKSDSSTR